MRFRPLLTASLAVLLLSITLPVQAQTKGGCANGVCAFPQDETANKEETIDDVDRQFQRMLQGEAGNKDDAGKGKMSGMGKMNGMNMAAMMQNCPCMKMMGMMMRQQGGGMMPGMDHGTMDMTAPKN